MKRTSYARAAALCILLTAVPASAQPKAEVHERAFEETDSGLFLRGGGSAVSIEVEERCDPACDEDQECQIECSTEGCGSDAAPGASCNRCDWTCVP